MSSYFLVHLENTPIYQQLQIEEALLRTNQSNWCLINKGSPPAIVLGISGKTEEHLHREAVIKKEIPVFRRFSGGGTVIVDENTVFVTWIANSEESEVPCCPKKILDWTTNIYRSSFTNIDFQLSENDYTLGSLKCGGNAQYLCKGRWLHHTSFLWDYRDENMQLLKMPPKIPAYRENRPHHEFICRLKNYFVSYDDFIKRLLTGISQQVVVRAPPENALALAAGSPHRQSSRRLNLHDNC